ncbi:PREDICTED: uncharacterized protein LOC106751999 [Dinoponera quadriceps]|uniref:Uncharacterized protein LOC106751999 n=1 Tax=Dinoponera quadriceps TaxID=609295 RepID=A0A6P3YCN5_DINQU|nr:PREDICTED: uncharacterized protein LOC106751999 [Dinoponera quadriceps]
MSGNSHWTEFRRRKISKTKLSEDKENEFSSQKAFVGNKDDAEKKKRFSAGVENQKKDIALTMSVQKLSIANNTQFQIYRDDNDKKERSRSLVRKSAYRNERRKTKEKVRKSPDCMKTLEREALNHSTTPAGLQRAHSLNCNENRVSLIGENKSTVMFSRR